MKRSVLLLLSALLLTVLYPLPLKASGRYNGTYRIAAVRQVFDGVSGNPIVLSDTEGMGGAIKITDKLILVTFNGLTLDILDKTTFLDIEEGDEAYKDDEAMGLLFSLVYEKEIIFSLLKGASREKGVYTFLYSPSEHMNIVYLTTKIE